MAYTFVNQPLVFPKSRSAAVGFCSLLAGGFVVCLYIRRASSERSRDDPRCIKERFLRIGVYALLSPVLLWWFAKSDNSGRLLLDWLGLRREGLLNAIVLPTLATVGLFAGPIVQSCVGEGLPAYNEIPESSRNLIVIRNIIVAPLVEEWVFRGCMMPVLVSAFGVPGAVVFDPLFFGIAHIHHMIENVRVHKKSWTEAALISGFQYSYTAIFGLYSAFLFVRTGHLAAPVVCHAFCNTMGFPDVEGLVEHPNKKALGVMYAAGMVTFALSLKSLTAANWYPGNPYA